MNCAEKLWKKEIIKKEIGNADTLFMMFASAPVLFVPLVLCLLVLAIPIKLFSPKTKIFR